MPDTTASKGYIQGIDSLRAVAALTVVAGHSGIIDPSLFGSHPHGLVAAMRLLSNCLFNGPAAVILFFVISGFCIHLPQVRRFGLFDIRTFYLRRGIRIGIPALASLAIYQSAGVSVSAIYSAIMWSLVCEAIYYALYPALLTLSRRIGWSVMVAVAYAAAVAVCITHMDTVRAAGNGYVVGPYTWVLGLPVWLLGAWVAEHRWLFPPASNKRLWLVRGGIFALAVVLRIVKFHMPLHGWYSNVYLLNVFALPAALWIGLEVASVRSAKSATLEWLGQRSYSLYLVHTVAITACHALGIAAILGVQPALLVQVAAAIALSLVFYELVERPSHRLTVSLGQRRMAVA